MRCNMSEPHRYANCDTGNVNWEQVMKAMLGIVLAFAALPVIAGDLEDGKQFLKSKEYSRAMTLTPKNVFLNRG